MMFMRAACPGARPSRQGPNAWRVPRRHPREHPGGGSLEAYKAGHSKINLLVKELIDTAIIIEELENSEKSAALREILAVVGEQVGMGDKQLTSLTRRLFKRERLGSTGIGTPQPGEQAW